LSSVGWHRQAQPGGVLREHGPASPKTAAYEDDDEDEDEDEDDKGDRMDTDLHGFSLMKRELGLVTIGNGFATVQSSEQCKRQALQMRCSMHLNVILRSEATKNLAVEVRSERSYEILRPLAAGPE